MLCFGGRRWVGEMIGSESEREFEVNKKMKGRAVRPCENESAGNARRQWRDKGARAHRHQTRVTSMSVALALRVDCVLCVGACAFRERAEEWARSNWAKAPLCACACVQEKS